MKIAIEAQRLFRAKKHGMDIVVLELIKHLQKIDFENEYFILVKPDIDNKILQETDNFHIIEIPGGPYPIWEQYYLPRVLKKLAPDILHCTSNTAPIFSKVPLVLTLHDILYMESIDFTKGTWYQRLGNLYRKLVVPQIISNCRKIITVSYFEKEEIDKYFSLDVDRVEVIYNAQNDSFKPIAEKVELQYFREKFNLPPQFILYLGNTHPNKNIYNVIEAIRLLNQECNTNTILVMPDVNREFLNAVLRDIGHPELAEVIHLTGYIENKYLKYIYNLASVFLYPSYYESFGIPILEAMSCGTPVITSNTTGMAEVCDTAAITVDPKNPDMIKAAIKQLLFNSQAHTDYREAGLRRASLFSWTQTAAKVLDLYQQVCVEKNA